MEGRGETNRRFDLIDHHLVELKREVAGLQAGVESMERRFAIAVIAVIVAIFLKGG